MQITETLNEGLKREIKIVVPAQDLEAKLQERLDSTKSKVKLKGFRPGKVPAGHLRKMYGKSFMAEVINEILNDSPQAILSERNERAALAPQIDMVEDEKEAEKVLNGNADFVFSLKYEILPEFELKDYKNLTITREVADIPEIDLEKGVEGALASTRTYTAKADAAEDGDQVVIDYLGKIDGAAFEGGADDDARLVLGSKQFIPGFEEQLVGVKVGEKKVITLTFPEEYPAAHLAGKEVTFDITVKEVNSPDELKIDDEAAKKLGLESLEKLRDAVRTQMENHYGSITRQKVKRQILDVLDGQYAFPTPESLVEAEFKTIWAQITAELKQNGRSFADEDTTEEEAQSEYRQLAERRVRLGLVLAKIGEGAAIAVNEQELQRALYEQVRRFPGQEKQVMEFFRSSPEAMANLRAPIYEDKVIDHLLTAIKVEDKKVSIADLLKEDEEEAPASEVEKKPKAKAKAKAEKKGKEAVENQETTPVKKVSSKKISSEKV